MNLSKTLKTAPMYFGFSGLSATIGLYSTGQIAFTEREIGFNFETIAAGVSLLAVPWVGSHIPVAIERRDATTSVIEERGYDERYVRKQARFWCGRQAVKVACEDTGNLQRFNETISSPEDDWQLTWLPHI